MFFVLAGICQQRSGTKDHDYNIWRKLEWRLSEFPAAPSHGFPNRFFCEESTSKKIH
jgi:hypothetical protein